MSRSGKRVCISGSVRKLHATPSCVALRFEGRAEEQAEMNAASIWFPRQHTPLLMAVPAAPLRAVFVLSSDGSSHSLKWSRPLSHAAESPEHQITAEASGFSPISRLVSLGLSANLKSRW